MCVSYLGHPFRNVALLRVVSSIRHFLYWQIGISVHRLNSLKVRDLSPTHIDSVVKNRNSVQMFLLSES